jgi:hypothetical protein
MKHPVYRTSKSGAKVLGGSGPAVAGAVRFPHPSPACGVRQLSGSGPRQLAASRHRWLDAERRGTRKQGPPLSKSASHQALTRVEDSAALARRFAGWGPCDLEQ